MSGTGELWGMSDEELDAIAAQNSEEWHNTDSQKEKDAYHAENVEINKIKDSRTGEHTTFDPVRGEWSPRKEPSAVGGGQGTGSGKVEFSYDTMPEYLEQNQAIIDAAAERLMGREAFSYDPETDPSYRQYKKQYTRLGERAMEDTLGQMAARTGGLASSYAGSVAQQSYNQYMSALGDKIPELRQLAYEMYKDEGDDLRADLNLMLAMEQMRYGKYQDKLRQYNTDRSFAYGQWSDRREYDYRRAQDEAAARRYEEEKAYQRGQDRYNKDLMSAEYLAGVGQYGRLAELLGYTEEETQALVDEYARKENLTKEEAAWQLAERYAQYGDFSKLEELGVDTGNLKQQQTASPRPQRGGPTEYPQDDDDEEQKPPKFRDRASAVEYMQQMGIEGHLASAAMDEKEWKHCRAEFRRTGKGDDTAAEYDTYSDYLNAYVQYCMDTYGK